MVLPSVEVLHCISFRLFRRNLTELDGGLDRDGRKQKGGKGGEKGGRKGGGGGGGGGKGWREEGREGGGEREREKTRKDLSHILYMYKLCYSNSSNHILIIVAIHLLP